MSGTWNPLIMHSRGAGEAVSKFRDVGMVSYHDKEEMGADFCLRLILSTNSFSGADA